jgi:protein phosphatase
MTVQSVRLSDRGRRKNNEDSAAFFEPTDPAELKSSGCLYIIADGVGGAAQGERASQFAAEKLLYDYYQPSTLEPSERMRDIMTHINNDIYAYATQNNTRMATTLVAAVVRGGYLYVANVGDSRAYLIRDGNVTQINRDHSIVGEMVSMGDMTEEEAMQSKIKNRLTRSLGGDDEVSVETYAPVALKSGDKLLLCSDGLTRYALRDDLAHMTADGTSEEIAHRLVRFANQKGGADNTSVVVVSYKSEGAMEPTVRIERPHQVDLDTLITQPGVREERKKIQRKRKAMSTTLWVIFGVGGLIAVMLLGWLVGSTLMRWPTTPTTIPPVPTQTNVTVAPKSNPVADVATAQALGTQQAVGQTQVAAEATSAAGATNQSGTAVAAEQTAAVVILNQTATAIAATQTASAVAGVDPGLSGKGSVATVDGTITATNACSVNIYVFSTTAQNSAIQEAYIAPGDIFSLTGRVQSGSTVWAGQPVSGVWLETSGPFHSHTEQIGWVFWYNDPCFKFTQGTRSVIFNQSALRFEYNPNP